jgi:hypothetical protein
MARSLRIMKYPRSARLYPLGITFAPPKEAQWSCLILIRCGETREPKEPKVIHFQDCVTHNS